MRLVAVLGLAALGALIGCQDLAYRKALASLQVKPPPMDHGLEAQALPSGLRLAVFQVPGQRDVMVSLALGGGWSDEPPGKAGLAQVALAAALRAPRFVGGASLQEQLYAAGALLDAGTEPDQSWVSVRCRPAFQAAVLQSLAALLGDPSTGVDEEGVRWAVRAVAATMEREAGSAASALAEVRRLAMVGTPFEGPGATPEGVRALTKEDVQAFLRRSYALPRTVLWVSTGRGAEVVSGQVVAALKGPAAGDAEHPVKPEPAFSAQPPTPHPERREVQLEGGSRPQLLFAWRAPGYQFWPAASRAGGELRYQLERRAAEADLAGKVRSVTYETSALDRVTTLTVRVELERLEDADLVRAALLATSQRPSNAWLWAGSAQEGRWRSDSRMERERSLSSGWMGPVGRLVRSTGSTDVPAWLDLNEQSQYGASARAWLNAWVTPGPAVVATVAPVPDTAPPPDMQAPVGEVAPPRAPGQVTWPTAPNAHIAAVPGPEALDQLLESNGLAAARSERLPNGLRLLALRHPGAPFVELSLFLPGGAVLPSEWQAANRALEAARAGLQGELCPIMPPAQAYADGVIVRWSGPPAWLPAMVEGAACWSRSLSAPGQRPPSPDEAMSLLAHEALLTGGPMPNPAGGTQWAADYLRRVAHVEGAVAVLVGDVDPSVALDQLRKGLDRFSAGTGDRLARATPAWPVARRIILQDVPGAKRASALVRLRLPDGLLPNSAVDVAYSWLFHGWTERTFGPSGFEAWARFSVIGDATFYGQGLTGPPARLPDAVAEILRELRRLRDQGPTAIDAAAARWDLARRLAYLHDSTSGAAYGLLTLAAAGLPLDGWDAQAREVQRVDAPSLQALLRSSAVGAEAILVTGDASTLVPLLRAEGLTPEVLAPPVAAAKTPAR
jgi:predicted Zn-dependent peptidase